MAHRKNLSFFIFTLHNLVFTLNDDFEQKRNDLHGPQKLHFGVCDPSQQSCASQ